MRPPPTASWFPTDRGTIGASRTTYTSFTAGISSSSVVNGVNASGSTIYAATAAGLSISTNGGAGRVADLNRLMTYNAYAQ